MTTETTALVLQDTNFAQTVAVDLENDPRLRSLHTKRGYLRDLLDFETWRDHRPWSKLLVEAYAAELQRVGKSPNSVNRALAAIRWHARRLADKLADRPVATDAERIARAEIIAQVERIASIRDLRGETEPAGRHIRTGEVKALLEACVSDPTPAGIRDAAIIAVAWSTGARRSELAELKLSDFQRTSDDDGDLRIFGKGNKVRTAYIYNGAASYLHDWLTLRGEVDGPLFYAVAKGGAIRVGHGLSDEALAQMLEKRRAEAGVKHLSWHDFRRTFAGNLLDNGNDLVTVQKLMGHSSPTTTANYDRRDDEVKRRASRSLHVPYLKSRLD